VVRANAFTVEYAQESRENFASISQAVCRSLDMSATVADLAKVFEGNAASAVIQGGSILSLRS
jgi:hypothetical protein